MEQAMPRTNDVDPGTAESVVFDNLDVSRDDVANDIESADADLRSEVDSERDTGSSRGRSRDPGDDRSGRSAPQRDPYPDRLQPQQGQQRQRDDMGRDRRVSHPQVPAGAEVRPDQHGNLVAADGTVVARAGREARLYQRAANEGTERIKRAFEQEQYKHSKVYQDYQTLQGKMGELDTLLRSYEERDETIKSIGLNPEHQVEAMRLFKQLTADYPGTLKKLLTQAAARGIDVNGMSQQGLDPKALTEAITEKFEALIKPIKERTEAEQARELEEAEAQRTQTELEGQVQDFFMQNRDAIPHMPIFLRVLEQPQYQNMTLGEIWARIQLSMARSARTGAAPNGNGRNVGPRPAVPNGRSHPQAGNTEMAPVSQSYEAILRDVIAEAGFGPNRR
jgi:hypothetical protein